MPAGRAEGLLVAFEGVEGSGKSTQIQLLRAALEAAGRTVVVTREPGGTPVGERIRALLLDPSLSEPSARAEALLFAAARAELVERVIAPALARGEVVLCDRFIESSLAYQGVARGLGVEDVARVSEWATGGLRADMVVLLDVEPEVGRSRAAGPPDRIEAHDDGFHQRVADAYRSLARSDPERFVVVDAGGSVEQVASEVRAGLDRWL